MTAPAIFHIGPVALTVSGILYALGIAALILLSLSIRGYTKGVPVKRMLPLFVFALPVALVFARAAYCLFGPESFSGRFGAVFALHTGGFQLTAAVAGIAVSALVYAHVYNLNARKLLDILVPGLLTLIALARFGDISPAQSTGQIASKGFLKNFLFTGRDLYGNARFKVSRLEAFAALAVLAVYASRFRKSLHTRMEDAPGEAFAFAVASVCALIIPIEAIRDGAYAKIFSMPFDLVACAAGLIALLCVSAAELWKTGVSRQFVLLRAVPGVALTITAMCLSLRAYEADPALNSFFILLCTVAACALTYSLRAATLRRLRQKKRAASGRTKAPSTVEAPNPAPETTTDASVSENAQTAPAEAESPSESAPASDDSANDQKETVPAPQAAETEKAV